MSDPFVDADVIVRLLTGDDPAKQAAARLLFKRVAAGDVVLATPATTIADVVFVLASPRLYALPRSDVAAMLTPLVRLSNFRVSDRREVLAALDIFAVTNLDFGDAMIVAAMRGAASQSLYSFDRDFDRVPGITRTEP